MKHIFTLLRLLTFWSCIGFLALTFSVKFGLFIGMHLTVLLWSCYVLCLPLSGGGIVFYPFSPLVTKRHSYIFEIAAWVGAVLCNAFYLQWYHWLYQMTPLTHWLQMILVNPFPHWLIIILAALPIGLAHVHYEYNYPARPLYYYHLRLLLIVISFICLFFFALRDIILLTNIHL